MLDSNLFTPPMTADNTEQFARSPAVNTPPLQWPHSTFCAKP